MDRWHEDENGLSRVIEAMPSGTHLGGTPLTSVCPQNGVYGSPSRVTVRTCQARYGLSARWCSASLTRDARRRTRDVGDMTLQPRNGTRVFRLGKRRDQRDMRACGDIRRPGIGCRIGCRSDRGLNGMHHTANQQPRQQRPASRKPHAQPGGPRCAFAWSRCVMHWRHVIQSEPRP